MQRRALLLAALATMAVFPLGAAPAHGQDRDHGEGRREAGPGPGWSRGERHRTYDGGPRRGAREGYEDRGRWRRFELRPADPPPNARPPPMGMRAGGYLPPAYRGGFVYDYQRYRLRPPPHGYAWVRVGRGFALVSLADGQIFDLVQ